MAETKLFQRRFFFAYYFIFHIARLVNCGLVSMDNFFSTIDFNITGGHFKFSFTSLLLTEKVILSDWTIVGNFSIFSCEIDGMILNCKTPLQK